MDSCADAVAWSQAMVLTGQACRLSARRPSPSPCHCSLPPRSCCTALWPWTGAWPRSSQDQLPPHSPLIWLHHTSRSQPGPFRLSQQPVQAFCAWCPACWGQREAQWGLPGWPCLCADPDQASALIRPSLTAACTSGRSWQQSSLPSRQLLPGCLWLWGSSLQQGWQQGSTVWRMLPLVLPWRRLAQRLPPTMASALALRQLLCSCVTWRYGHSAVWASDAAQCHGPGKLCSVHGLVAGSEHLVHHMLLQAKEMVLARKAEGHAAAPVMYELTWPVESPAALSSTRRAGSLLWTVRGPSCTLKAAARHLSPALPAHGMRMLRQAAKSQASGSVCLGVDLCPADQVQ